VCRVPEAAFQREYFTGQYYGMPMAERVHVSGIMKSIAMNSEMIEAVCFMDCVTMVMTPGRVD
jgi:hypothetical protein